MMDEKKCPVCEKKDLSLLSKYRGSHKTFLGLDLQKCNSCKMIFASPMPSKESLVQFNETYFESAHGGHRIDKSSIAFYAGISQLRGYYVRKYIDSSGSQSNHLLEIGPGPGAFAKNWIERNPDTQYYAIETRHY